MNRAACILAAITHEIDQWENLPPLIILGLCMLAFSAVCFVASILVQMWQGKTVKEGKEV